MNLLTRRFLLAAAFVALWQAGPTWAANRNVGSGLIGNTVELVGPSGATRIYYSNRNDIIVRLADGKQMRGWWRIKGRSICTKLGDKPENCTAPIDEPPVAGSSGVISGPGGDITWTVTKGRGF